ncbi:thioredoxin family protein [Rasiella rasia]|uniref:Thioredoxin family protein n=1 Tax=Rasiella rasia TaxID=2744027 RepID=A0A6G6GLS9_9FLAO|nr:thioredoxin family protein [Rasiella rasia]QIE59519.1 thioredoxin family protein [Rasiella rasia]
MKISEKTKEVLVAKAMTEATDYTAYRELVAAHAQQETSTGAIQTEALSEYTQLSNARMRRLDKTLKIPEAVATAFKNTSSKQQWLVLTESWCGDAAQSMPAMQKVADLAEGITLSVVLRDEHPELMDAFLTNGSRSIPKLIVFDTEKNKVITSWGPRPSVATKMVNDFKAAHGTLTPEFKRDLQVWYTKDKGQNIFEDLARLID